ncbi:MAG: cyclic nucleotide-binding/CBS domain-containing protein [Candidatus Bathyarchaeia archaeon]
MVYAVRHVMSKPLITVDDGSSVQDAVLLMVEKDIGALAVTEKGKPVGMVTDRDVMKKCCPQASCREVKVREIMSKPLVTVNSETPIDVAVEIMTNKNIRRLLVTEGEKIVGIVTLKDLMRGASIAFHALDLALSVI